MEFDNTVRASAPNTRVGLFSLRNKEKHVSRCSDYEFENAICGFDNVDLILPEPIEERPRSLGLIGRVARRLTIHRSQLQVRPLQLKKDYDLFFASCQQMSDLSILDACRDWRVRAKKAVCWLSELWSNDLPRYGRYLEILSQFDYIILNFYFSTEPLEKLVNKPVIYMVTGVDAIRFSPYPHPPDRCIYLSSIGRRSPKTHEALLDHCERNGLFYIYDTYRDMSTPSFEQHRKFLSNVIKRSRYFVANRAKIDCPFETMGQSEIAPRFVEGAAGGAVLIGEPPARLVQDFDWPDAVISVPFHSPNITDILSELDKDPERLGRIRRQGIVNSLRRNDWVYKWARILDAAGISYTQRMKERIKNLHSLADMVLHSPP